MSETILHARNASAAYGSRLVLEAIDLAVHRGEFLGITGPNGGGKSTLLKLFLGLLDPVEGTVTVFGEPPRRSRHRIGYVPQSAAFDPGFPITLHELVMQGRLSRSRLFARPSKADRAAVENALAQVELTPLGKRPAGTLSGGEAQRALIARALCGEPDVLVLDEPTASLDSRVEGAIYELLDRLRKEITIVAVSHDIGFVTSYADRIACVNRTLVCHAPGQFAGEAISRLYGMPIRVIDHASRER